MSFKRYFTPLLAFSFFFLFLNFVSAQGLIYPPTTSWYQIDLPNVSRPGYLESYIDPNFATRVTRVTESEVFGISNPRHHYSKDPVWNSDGTLIMIKQWLLDGHDYKILRKCSALSGETRWSYQNPNIVYSRKGNKFVKIDVRTCQETTLRTFSECGSLYLGPWEGNLSIDDKYVAFQCDSRFLVYNIQTNNIEADKSFGGSLDWVSMSQSGNYIVANWNSNGTGRSQGVEVFDRQLNFLRQIATTGEHADICYDVNGDDVYVHVIPFEMVRLRDGNKTQLLLNKNKFSGHVSCRNFKRPGWAYATMQDTHGDIFAIKLDWSDLGKVQRFAHHHSNRSSYEAEPHGVVNPLGTQVMFASNWSGTSEINSYVAEMPQDYPTTTPQDSIPGDADNDGNVDIVDYVIWLNYYNQLTGNGSSDGDFNNSGSVGGLDYVIWLNNYSM